MKIEEIRKKDNTELNSMIIDLKKEAFNLRFQKAAGSLTKTDRMREVRKAVAKIMTVLNERKLNLEVKNA